MTDLDRSRRAIRTWLLAVAALVFAMVLVGGATRLTESGLSIVEWQPVAGALPPLSPAAWQAQFDKYKTIPQYQALNPGMSLDAFKTIFWWEWAHRLLGRLIGAAFLLPFLWFLLTGRVEPRLRPRLWMIFGLGAFQGAAGWWMVASGLANRVEVSQYRLAFHLTLAGLIYVALLWTAQGLAPRSGTTVPTRLRSSAKFLVALVLVQIYLGALVAGLRAGLIYNTWPLIDGGLVPASSQLWFNEPWWRNIFENPLTVQFDHRMVAYVLLAAAILHAVDVTRTLRRGAALRSAFTLAAAVTLQAALGILTLLAQAPLGLALMHQATAMIVLTIAVLHGRALAAPEGAHSAELNAGPADKLGAMARG
ncbi:MAG TPA: COX15/CtaA family protein [Xanthobacteraceae bacterium]|nr:COX15/CtaA family protein [Xanthobacteraceae bacterium]